MAYFSSRVVLLTFLYFIQGLPYGLQARFLPVYLRTKGHSLTNLGLFKMLLAPWLCKALWAPLVDKYASKQKWLLWSISGLMVTCAVTSMIPPDNILLLCLCIFSLNLFAATQDIAVDSIALTILPPDELGKGNTAQVVGYKIGAIFGGGILVWFMDVLGWRGLFIALTLLYIEALLFVYLSPTLRVLKRLGVVRNEPTNSPSSGKEKGKQKLETHSDDIPQDPKREKDFVQKTEKLKTTRSDLSEKVDPIIPETQNNSKETQKEDVSALIKSALEFLETKDDLERNLELRHDLRVKELGAEKQKEIIKEIVDACPLQPPVPAEEEVAKEEGDAQGTNQDKNKTEEADTKYVAGEEDADNGVSKTESRDEPEVDEGKEEKVPSDNRKTHAADLPGELVLSGKQQEAVSNADKKTSALKKDSPGEIVENGFQSKSSRDNEKATRGVPDTLEMAAAQREASDDNGQTSAAEEETRGETLENGDEAEPSDGNNKTSAAELDSPEELEVDGHQQKVSTDNKAAGAAVKGSPGDIEVDGETPQTSDDNQHADCAEISNLESSNVESSADAAPGAPVVEELGYLDDDASENHESATDPDDSATGAESEEDEESDLGNLEGLNEELLDDNVFLQEEEEEVVKESDDEDSFTCSSVRVSGRFAFLWDVIMVPNTLWIMVYVIIYKLGEQGAVGMLPLFLVDHDVNTVDVTFWTGVIGQATSMLGSCLGGWILSHPVYKLPCRLLIYQLSLCRLLPLGLLLWVVLLWSGDVFPPTILYRAAIVAMNLLLLVSGMVTTATFTLMMECSQTAPRGVQATHYTLLSSMEVFGKLTFMSVCGALVDYFGYTTMYLSFVLLSAAILPWLWRYPDILCEKKMS